MHRHLWILHLVAVESLISKLLSFTVIKDKLDAVTGNLFPMNNYQPQTEDIQQASIETIVAQRVKAIATIIDKVRRSQDINTIFSYTTQGLRSVLHSDRLITSAR